MQCAHLHLFTPYPFSMWGGRVRVGGEGVEIDATTYMVEMERQTRGMVD